MQFLNGQDYIQQVSIDCVIFGYQKKQLKVLVPKLALKGDFSSLPGGFILQNESIDQAARRILQARTGLKDIYLEQFRVFGDLGRNNMPFFEQIVGLNQEQQGAESFNRKELEWITRRFISIGYYALVDIHQVVPQKSEIDQSIEWYTINELPSMIMDHNQIVDDALQSLRLSLDQKLIGFTLLPEIFTMKDLQELYETIYDKPFARNNFQKKMLELDVLDRLEKKFTGAANKAPYLYRFRK
ncbi:NUDIX domain-containing protein [Cytophagaceae bacterium YF14B1]|uniref:NUDIX domain-containing protein n=1 Tax=Xanthocytophaga flava TaxID=3048013 RepID=A0AAE3UAL4_9BACT|nr:NUDIX domain-containing protein [Xanthocytophaga flavus]MDJ1486269.1 NUDIX domain-containing protein [Xanthocytophaga flavus]